jgi:hypothetical protein
MHVHVNHAGQDDLARTIYALFPFKIAPDGANLLIKRDIKFLKFAVYENLSTSDDSHTLSRCSL